MRPLARTVSLLARVRPSLAPRATAARRRFHLVSPSDAVAWTAESIGALHSLGLPWLVTLPLAAVGVNFCLRLPAQYYSRQLNYKRTQLSPLVTAWGARHTVESFDIWRTSRKVAQFHASRGLERSRRRIYKTWGVQPWKSFASVCAFSFAPFIVVTEAVRRLCGAPAGWIGHFLRPGTDSAGVSVSLFDGTLTDGGILWIHDLTAADPYYTLPLLCSGILARHSWGRLTVEKLRKLLAMDDTVGPLTPLARLQGAVGRVLLLVPLLPVLVGDLPSALFVFWATTFALTDVNESILERIVPKADPRLKPPLGQQTFNERPYLRGQRPVASPTD